VEFFPSEPYDVAVLCCVLEHYPPEIRLMVLRHCRQWLRPGGEAIIVVAVGDGSFDIACEGQHGGLSPSGYLAAIAAHSGWGCTCDRRERTANNDGGKQVLRREAAVGKAR